MQSFLGAYKMHYMRLIYQQNISLCMHIVQFNVLYTFVGIIVSLNIKYENTNPTAVLLFQTVLQCLFTVRESGVLVSTAEMTLTSHSLQHQLFIKHPA